MGPTLFELREAFVNNSKMLLDIVQVLVLKVGPIAGLSLQYLLQPAEHLNHVRSCLTLLARVPVQTGHYCFLLPILVIDDS